MISQTKLTPSQIMTQIGKSVTAVNNALKLGQTGDVKSDAVILEHIFWISDHSKKLVYSYLHYLEHEGKLNHANIPALQMIEKMDDDIRKHSREAIEEDNYLRKLAAHFEALTESKLKEAAKMTKHIDMAKKYAKLAEEHERIAQAMEKQ